MAGGQATAAETERVVALDLLRGVAALAVAVPHFFAYRTVFPETAETISALAVEVFFVLSGYVLAPQILFCLAACSPRHLGVFLVRRWMRTIPPYVIALLMISALGRQLGTGDFFRYLFYVQNLFRQSNTIDYFAIAWSLSVEEWFYIGFPTMLLIAAAIFSRRGWRFAFGFGVGFCVFILAARLAFGDMTAWGAEVRRVVLFRLDSIGYGFLLCVAMRHGGVEWLHRARPWIPVAAFVVLTAAAYAVLTRIAETGDLAVAHAFPFLAALFGAAAILVAERADALVRGRPLVARLATFLGRVSYSAYLFHIIIIEVMAALFRAWPGAVQLPLFLVVLFGFTAAFYRYVESPILAARPRYRGQQPSLAAARQGVTAA